MVTTAFLAIYAFVWVESKTNRDIAPITGITWAAYQQDCGHAQWLKNRRITENTFINKYVQKGVQWDGYVVRVLLAEDDGSA